MLVEGNQREGERVRNRETYLQSMLRCESRPAGGWDAARSLARGGMSTLRRVSGSNESRAAVRRAVVARYHSWRESSGRRAVRARTYARGAQDGGLRGQGLMLGHTRTLRHNRTRLQAAYRGQTKPTRAW